MKSKPTFFNSTGAYVPTTKFKISLPRPLHQRGWSGVVSDRILVSLLQLGVKMENVCVFKNSAVVTVVTPTNVTMRDVVDHVTARVNSVMRAFA